MSDVCALSELTPLGMSLPVLQLGSPLARSGLEVPEGGGHTGGQEKGQVQAVLRAQEAPAGKIVL